MKLETLIIGSLLLLDTFLLEEHSRYMRDWKRYLEKTKGKKPSHLMVEAMGYVENMGRALDLGAGAMSDTRYMQENGFREIDVVDIEPAVAAIAPKGVNVYIMSYEEFSFPLSVYDFVNAQYALPFAGDSLDDVMERTRNSLKHRGIFSGTFFGPDDDWASDPEIAVVTRDWIDKFFNSREWNVYKIEEEREARPTAAGSLKNWHVFNIIASRIR